MMSHRQRGHSPTLPGVLGQVIRRPDGDADGECEESGADNKNLHL
jgi:hypothetical protein